MLQVTAEQGTTSCYIDWVISVRLSEASGPACLAYLHMSAAYFNTIIVDFSEYRSMSICSTRPS